MRRVTAQSNLSEQRNCRRRRLQFGQDALNWPEARKSISRGQISPPELQPGTYYAKNLGLKVCRGEYVFFQDSDDISHPMRVALLLAQLRASKKRVVRGSYSRIDPETDQVIEVNGLASKLGLITLGIERKVFEEIGYFNCTTKASDDEFYNRIVKFLGKSAVVSNELPLYYNTYRDGSLFADMVTRTANGGIQQRRPSRAHTT